MSDETSLDILIAEATNMDTPPERLAQLAYKAPLQETVAANPATPPATLTALSHVRSKDIRRAVVQNPNTPLKTLYELAGEFPGEFLNNPLLPFLHMTRPNFIKELPFVAWEGLLSFAHLPKSWLQQAANERAYPNRKMELWELIQLHTMQQIPAQWRQQAHSWLKKYQTELLPAKLPTGLKKYQDILLPAKPFASTEEVMLFLLFISLFPYTSSLLKEQWLHVLPVAPRQAGIALANSMTISKRAVLPLAKTQDIFVLSQIARHALTSTRTLQKLSLHVDAEVRRAVASNPHTLLNTVLMLASDKTTTVRRAAASHPALTQEDCAILALDEEGAVRAALAARFELSPALYTTLAQDAAPEVRAALARNVKVPQELLGRLARDAEAVVRAAATGNPRLPAAIMQELVSDPDMAVRASLSGNARLPEACIKRLARDTAPLVLRYLAANARIAPSLLAELARMDKMEIWLGVARHPQATPELLERLARVGDWRVCAAVAAHKHTPAHVLHKLAQNQEPAIWHALASNPHTPLDLLERAIAQPDLDLRLRILHHPAMQQAHLRPFLTLLLDEVQHRIATNALPDWLRRAVFQYHRALPIQLLTLFADSPHWEERYLAARHPRMGDEVLDRLANDGIVYVRAQASEALKRRRRA